MSIPPSASVTYRLPVVASVAGAEALAGLGVNHDALAVSPEMAHLQLVSLGTQKVHCIGREAVFDENLIGEPLMMKPGCIDRFGNVEREIHHPHKDVGDGRDNSRTARRTHNQE